MYDSEDVALSDVGVVGGDLIRLVLVSAADAPLPMDVTLPRQAQSKYCAREDTTSLARSV